MPDSLSLLRAYDSDTNPSRPIRSSPLTASTIQGLPLELIDRLRSFPLFASAPDSFLAAIGRYLRPQLHQPNDSILSEGDDARAMYWLVRGSVRVTSRDGESTYAELKPGAFFGEIGILMDIPRTATITAKARSLVVRLNKEDLQNELPRYPQVERAIREEAVERLAILERKKKENAGGSLSSAPTFRKRSRDFMAGDVEMGEAGDLSDGEILKKRKSPSPSLAEAVASSAFGHSHVTVRQILKELPLFSELPPEILHFLGVNAQPCTFPPFTEIIQQGTQGREVYFIVQGEVEVVTETPTGDDPMTGDAQLEMSQTIQRVRARFKPGQYFGEVVSLSLAPKRTATVRSINEVECLRITGEVLDELWRKCSPDLRQQVELEAKRRLEDREDPSAAHRALSESRSPTSVGGGRRRITPTVTFTEVGFDVPSSLENISTPEPLDPDPFFGGDRDMRSRSRRSSLAPPVADSPQSSPPSSRPQSASPYSLRSSPSIPPSPEVNPSSTISSPTFREPNKHGKGILPDSLLVLIMQHLDLVDLARLRIVSPHWHNLISTSDDLLHTLDLSRCNKRITDKALVTSICSLVGSRPRYVNMNNCFHVTDEGFNALAAACGQNARSWRMRSVWDVTGQSILNLVSNASNLEEIDLSNCRKVGDNLLARIVGWVAPQQQQSSVAAGFGLRLTTSMNSIDKSNSTTGSPKLKRLTLSYCKHIQDRSMAHIAQFAATHLEVIDLTRCTSVTDQGFQHWSMHSFPVLRKLVLADCTYLTDQAIVGIANAARNLKELDLVS